MKVAIHQPNFLPWAGYFIKMAACDTFVFHDNVQITKSGPTRRVKISAKHTADHVQWLTVPLKKHSDYALIKDLEVSWDKDWTQSHLAKIFNSYRKFPNFDFTYTILERWYSNAKNINNLSELNIYLIRQVVSLLGIDKSFIKSSDLSVTGKAETYNLAICVNLGATHYLSGTGGSAYQNNSEFLNSGIELKVLNSKKLLETYFQELNINQINLSNSIIELLMYFKDLKLLADFINEIKIG